MSSEWKQAWASSNGDGEGPDVSTAEIVMAFKRELEACNDIGIDVDGLTAIFFTELVRTHELSVKR